MSTHTCPGCGENIDCDGYNSVRFDPQIIACPFCRTGPKQTQTIVAVEFQGIFYDPSHFLSSPSKNGILPVTTDEELKAFEVMRYAAMSEETGFTIQEKHAMRIKWINGEAIGFYTDYQIFGVPRLSHIYVRPGFRGNGYAENMVDKFLTDHPQGDLDLLEPNDKVENLIQKMGTRANRIKFVGAV